MTDVDGHFRRADYSAFSVDAAKNYAADFGGFVEPNAWGLRNDFKQ